MRHHVVRLAICALALSACSPGVNTSTARARRITTKKELIGGPHALGDIGDYLLENNDARFIIQAEGYSRGFGVFGGGLIDADIQRPISPGDDNGPVGQDNFAEMFPAFFLVAMEPRQFRGQPAMEILPPGPDGSAAVKIRGLANQFLALTEAINNAIVEPGNLEFETVYRLPPQGRTMEITTTVINGGVAPHSFKDRRFTGSVALDVPFGDVILFGAGNKVFAPGDGGFDLRYRLEGRYKEPISLPALPGLITDYLASRGDHVSYGFFLDTKEFEKGFVMDHADAYGDRAKPGRMLVPFFASAFTGVFHTQGPEELLPDEGFTFTRYFTVGDGDIASIAEEVYRVRETAHGEITGRVLDAQTQQPIPGASVIALDGDGQPVSQATPRGGGTFRMPLPEGEYRLIVTAEGRDPTVPEKVNVRNGRQSAVELRVAPAARLTVAARDADGAPIPCKVTVVGRYTADQAGRDPKTHLFSLALGEDWRGTDLIPDSIDDDTRQFIEAAFISPDGTLSEVLRPGTYDVYVSRGPEYDVHITRDVQILPGGTASVRATLNRVVNTDGFVSADFHIHSVKSIDSSLALEPRVISYAAEGVEVMVSTDHNFVTDYKPTISALGLEQWIQSFVGLELTTLEMGHFNGYPLRYDIPSATHGSFEWSSRTPDEIFNGLRDMGQLGPENTIVQVNHPRDTILGYFNQFVWDQETGIAYGQNDPVLGINTTNYPNFAPENFSLDFDALEIFNGKRFEFIHNYVVPDPLPPPPLPEGLNYTPGEILRDESGAIAFPGQVDDWFTLLRMGHRFTGVANSDSHGLMFEEAGYPRTYIRTGTDVPGRVDANGMVRSIRNMEALMTNGPFVTLSVEGEGMGGTATRREDGKVRVSGQVRTAPWVRPDTLHIFLNGTVVRTLSIPKEARTFDFNEELDVTGDSFVVVEVTGGDSLFPVVPTFDEPPLLINDAIGAIGGAFGFGGDPYGNLQPPKTFQVTPLAITNPVFIDTDGNGAYDAPGVMLNRRMRAQVGPAWPPPGDSLRAHGPLNLPDIIRKPVRGQALDIRRIFQAFDHHH